ncbi:hypothetical protein, variant 4 [Phytophthora nicotianae P10297]|uniref:HSA domain-containing protein n=1 Tax=Phytophthora nicotianae P10297 TaxID=1317064 RepID=W2YHF5_PHYNI|nr:hypothetical protein F442_17219 [Phytophthora nicotianae P10297]ETP34483.1 hypothetical protein, variant 1 [Phytophthora nicotianae P10297]ETP34484.1 hypothetical protein, variant 2 [Phytophthora nicotianae P10297]ETP34485.1 hypothetical protein, variant 3 [Phytophthora nicotianae P10297]ETP34486.1 hypothetical protein, variant 4 [Phytophthora nicotianae P10297]
MTSDSDGNTSSTVVLRSIRVKLVEYKESLLRQLVDEREAALAASKEQKRVDVKEDGGNSLADEEEVSQKEEKQVEAAEAEERKPENDESTVAVEESIAETESESAAAVEEFIEKSPSFNDEVILKKRRLAEEESVVQAEKDAIAVKKAKKSKAKSHQQPEEPADSNNVLLEEKTDSSTAVDAVEHQALPLGPPYRVVRTSVPPTKYLMQTRRDEEASNLKALHQQPVLKTSPTPADHSTSNGVAGIKRPVSTPRSSSTSMDSTNAEFEGKLRESVRLHREVNKRSLTVTRKRQLPRLPTPARGKSHWDFLLEEMKWMATDFSQERNWKRVIQHRLAADVIVARNAENVRQEQENRQMARGIALQISAFWRTMERIAARSRVRFEAAGTDPLSQGEMDDPMSGDRSEDDGKRGKSEDLEVTGTDDDGFTLKYHTIEVAQSNGSNVISGGKGDAKPEAVLASAKTHMTYIVSAGKRARSAMTPSSAECADKSSTWSLREAAFRDLQARCNALQTKGGPTIILAAFQLLALRWMLDLYSSGLNIFLNDQLGMGKATTIVAFLSLIEIVSSKKLSQQQESDNAVSSPEDPVIDKLIGPHLIIVSEEELHKWRYYLRIWHPGRRIQLYDGVGNTPSYREQLQREWKIKSRAHAHKTEDGFLEAPVHGDDGELDDDERTDPVYCVLCPVSAFAQDREAFVAFANWQMVVVENEHGGQFDDAACVSALQQLRQQQRRVLCNGQSLENWKNTALRLQYAEFLVREAPALTDDVTESSHRLETWPVQELQVERASVAEVMQFYGKSSSVRASLWKASSQDDAPQYMNALLLALSCLSLRRVRSEVESELGKIDEISLSCQPSPSQRTQYRNALSGFAATLDTSSGREERLSVWLQLLLRLREICNCVDIVNDMDKLGHADVRLLTSCSAKLEALEPLLRRLVLQEGKKVVIYSQFNAMFPILEFFLSLLDINYVRVTGSVTMQRRALCHFADRPVVRVALASTRLSMSNGRRAVSVFGGEAIIVVDGDWNTTCDAKLRASWAKMAVGGADTLPVYRLHCENTIESSLLRVGASLTEKVFGEMSPQELLAVPSDMTLSLTIEKPSWWSSTATSSGGNGLTDTGAMAKLSRVAQQVENDEKYCGDANELEAPLIVHNVDLDAEEHLLLANTDELTPVEWYAVNYVHGVTDKKQQGDGKTVESAESVEDEGSTSLNDSNAFLQSDERSFEKLATLETNRLWQEGDAASQLFFTLDSRYSGVDEHALDKLFMQMRMEGMETHFDVYKPPQPPLSEASNVPRLSSEVGSNTGNQMTFRVSYRVPAPPPAPLPGKSKVDQAVDLSKLSKANKKQRANVARAGMSGLASGSSTNATAASAGVKRKLESQLGGIKSGSQKEMRVDLEGIPVPDVSEFADDDFWGDTNLDALDSAEWDDPALLSGILGVGVGAGTGTSSTSSSGTVSSGTSAAPTNAAGASGVMDAGHHSKTGSQKSSKKSKTGTGRARKSSMSSDSGREAWSVHDDIILKKLFELYGANWTLIAQVFNSSTAVSRFVCKKRSPRQCYDRYGKIISGSLATSTGSATKDSKSGLKAQRAAQAANAAAAQLTSAVLDTRIGLPQSELLLKFPSRHSLPGLPPASIASAPSLVEMTLAHRKQATDAKKPTGTDDLKSIKTSFDAIIQCMKHKTSPPPIPIPVGTGSTSTSTESSSDLGTKASLTAALSASEAPTPTSTAPMSTPTKATATSAKKATVSPSAAAKAMPVVVPPPHKSHTDMVSLLPTAVLGPDEVIKRSKEAAVEAVQAAAAVASVGRDGSPLSASGDVMLGAGSNFGAAVSGSMPRRSHAASLTSEMTAVGVMSTSSIAPTVPATGSTTATGSWGGNMIQTNGLNATASLELNGASVIPGAAGNEPQRAMPVTTSTLLHVLDRMPEIKNKIQSILNRTDCSESQKVAMIARLLSNTNAISNTNALTASAPPTATSNSNTVLSALTADASMLNSSDMLIDTDTPIPMPSSLATPSPSSVATPQGQFQSPPASQP